MSRGALYAVLGLVTLGAGGCASDSEAPEEPIAGLVDDCRSSVERDLFFLGLPVNGRLGSASSHYDPRTLPTGGPGFYPLALGVLDHDSRNHRTSSSELGGSTDQRCDMVEDLFLSGRLTASRGEPLDPQRYPLGVGEVAVNVDLRFDDVVFPATPAQVAVPFDPATRAAIPVAAQAIMPTRMSLVVRYLAPLDDGSTAIVEQQEVPLAFACETGFPLTASWQAASFDGPFCAKNDQGDNYCLIYDVRHGGGDCRFAATGAELKTIHGEVIAADLAGSLDRIFEGGALTGMALKVDTIQLR